MGKSCQTCKHLKLHSCSHLNCESIDNFPEWEAKEMERIQMTEEQAREMIENISVSLLEKGYDSAYVVKGLKQAGFIKKDIVELAEEMYYKLHDWEMSPQYRNCLDKQHEAIQLLKKEVASYNNRKNESMEER